MWYTIVISILISMDMILEGQHIHFIGHNHSDRETTRKCQLEEEICNHVRRRHIQANKIGVMTRGYLDNPKVVTRWRVFWQLCLYPAYPPVSAQPSLTLLTKPRFGDAFDRLPGIRPPLVWSATSLTRATSTQQSAPTMRWTAVMSEASRT
jgi:hypothetical protein